jgi:predicted nucleic acid-binding protein
VRSAPAARSRKIALSAERRLIYADSSALVKLVIDEPESDALEHHVGAGESLLATSRIAVVEVKRATGVANPSPEVRKTTDRLLRACALVEVTPAVIDVAASLASPTVRTLDAIHVASALRIEAEELLAYDRRLAAAAAAHGLAVVSPGA